MTEQAGVVAVRIRNGVSQVVLVTSKRNPAHWVFPKGHVEDGETFEQTALREAEEEAGVRGRVVARVGTLRFTLEDEKLLIRFFLVTTSDEGRPEKGRRLQWCTYEEALEQLTFENSRALLKEAWKKLPRL
jgi:8-oxo-dGTP pyrophosphatase MutT (NUDIX family)